MRAAITTILVMAGILAVGVMGANPTMIERLKIGGGYGSSGVDIDQDGNVSADGDLLVDGVVKAGSTPVTLTAADGKLLHAAIQQNSASSGQALKWNGSAWAPAADTDTDTTYTAGTGLLLSTTQFSLSHLGIQSLTDPGADRILFWDESENASKWLTLGTNLAISGTTINATDTNTTYTAGTGLNLATTTFSLSHLGIQSLTDPDDDRVLFWDDSEGAAKWLDIGSSINITNNTINIMNGTSYGHILKWNGSWWTLATDTNTTYTAGTGLNLATTTFSLSHLGIQALADPDDDRIFFWDDGDGAAKWLDIGTNLEISGTTLNATGGGSLPSGSEHQTLRYDDPNGWEAAANLTNTGTYVTVIGTGADVQPLDIYHATNAAADSEVHISFTSSDPDGNATPTIGTVGFEIEAVDATDILDADFIVKTKQAGGAATERFRVADTTLTDSSGMLKQAAIEQNSATIGQALVWGGSAWAPGSVASFPAGATNTTLRYSGTNTVANTDKFKIDSSGNITADGTITAGSGPTTLTNASGKVLMAALEKTTYSVLKPGLGYYDMIGIGYASAAQGFVNGTSDNAFYLYYVLTVPTDYKSGGAIIVRYVFSPDNSSNNIVFGSGIAEIPSGSAFNTITTTQQKWTVAAGTAGSLYTTSYTYSSGVSGLEAGEMFRFDCMRHGTDGSDTNNGGVDIYSITIEFER